MLTFITGNDNKFSEVKAIIPEIIQLDLDLPEIQSLDPQEIVEFKLKEAAKTLPGNFIVEDTSLYIEGLHGLPGPFVKWFIKSLGREGLAKLAIGSGANYAEARTIIGYADDSGNTHYFEGRISGKIVMPLGETSFGWDPIFQPDGYEVTFAEMEIDEKNKISMRRQAAQKLADFLAV